MPRRIFNFDEPDRFVCGAVGQPGQRTFFLQARKGGQTVSVVLEKAQVAVLAERVATLLLALRQRGVEIVEETGAALPELAQPVVEEFRVGTLTLSWDADLERVVIEAREIGEGDEDEEEDEEDEEEAVAEPADQAVEPAEAVRKALSALAEDAADDLDVVRVQLDPSAALEFASGAIAVVQAGRPPCPQCGAPLEPTGHFCPRRNGYSH
jgi:uncharacterized repeat protein (TIGR03847 family)